MRRYLVIMLLFGLPLVFVRSGISPFETPKVIVAEIGIELLFLFTLIKLKHRMLRFVALLPAIYLLGLFILSYYHAVLAFSWTEIFGNVFRLQGVVLFWLLLLFAVLSATIPLKKLSVWIPFCSLALVTGFALVMGHTSSARAYGTLGEPNALAAIGIFCWPFIALQHKQKYRLLLCCISFICVCILLTTTQSRSALIACTIQLVFILLQYKIDLKTSTIICVVLILLSFLLPFFQINTYEKRSDVWLVAAYAGAMHPIFGGGFGNMIPLFHASAVALNNELQVTTVDSAHNIFLDYWVQGGSIGLGLFVLLLGFVITTLIMQKLRRELVVLLGLLTVASFNPISVVALLQLWWVIGQGITRVHNGSAMD